MDDFLILDKQLTDDELMIRATVERFVKDEVVDKLPDAYEKGYFPKEFIPKMAQLGLFGMTLPAEYGGSEANYTSYGLVCQELERGDSGLRSFVSVQSSLCMFPIYAYGSDHQKQTYLKKMADGEVIGCFGLTEADSGSNPGKMQTFAKKVSGGWELNGSKLWITNAPIADIAIVWANTDEGIRGFIVDATTTGFSANEIKHKMSLRASSTGELVFDKCFVPDDTLLPGTDCGIKAPLSCLSKARYGIAWGAIGAAIACYDAALAYTNERTQFDRPISSHQLVQKDLVDMFSEIIKSQCLNIQLGRLHDANEITPEMISLGKRNACQQALKIARSARNLLGANGISLEYPVIRHMMNLESVFTYEGTDNIHTLILGKAITGQNAFI